MDNPDENNQPAGDQLPEVPPEQPGDGQQTQPETERKFKVTGQFAGGFLGWYVLIGLLYVVLFPSRPSTGDEAAIICSGLIFPLQVVVLIILLSKKDIRDAGWGMLSALGINLVVSLLLGLATNALCFIPFFYPME